MTILFYSNRPSNGLTNLKEAIEAVLPRGALKLRASGSSRNVRAQDLLVNWGCSTVDIPAANLRSCLPERYLNKPEAIAVAADKKKAFVKMREANIPTVEWTTDAQQAQTWLDAGSIVYSRTRLSGHSGEGIVLSFNNPAGVGDAGNAYVVRDTIPTAPLYTKAVMGQRREWRVHVMKGQVIHVQQKKRANGFEANPSYSNLVRNHHTGWIYATSDIQLPAGVGETAIRTVAALGLDFGAVDIITRQGSTYVLEVNTACGQEAGQTLDAYTNALLAVHNNTAIPAAVVVQADSVETAVPESRLRDEIDAEATDAYNSIRAYINATSHLNANGGSLRDGFLRRVAIFRGEYLELRDEEGLRTVKNKFNKLKAAIQRVGEKVPAVEARWNASSRQVKARFNPDNYRRRLIEVFTKDTAAEVSEVADLFTAALASELTNIQRELSEAEQARIDAANAATAQSDTSLEIANSFGEWLEGQVRSTRMTASQIMNVLRTDFQL